MKWWWTTAFIALGTGCAGHSDWMRKAENQPCDAVIAKHAEVSSDPEYREESTGFRENYERVVANCYLEANRPKEALALAKAWSERSRSNRLQIEALAAADAGDEAALRTALEALATPGPDSVDTAFFSDRRFAPYGDRDWFLKAALRAWDPGSPITLEQHVANILGRAGHGMLSLKVAAADPSRPPGDWALWLGIVRSGKLDRENQRTLVFAEGADVDKALERVDQRVERVESTAQRNFWGGVSGTATPIYGPEQRTYRENFTSNGQRFVIRFDGIDEHLLEAPVLSVLGRFAGFDPTDHTPIIDAVLAQVRTPQEKTETGPPGQ